MSILSKSDANKRDKGFTLIELVVVLVVVSVLTVFAMASKPKVMDMVHTYEFKTQISDVITAIEVNKGINAGYEKMFGQWEDTPVTIDTMCKNSTLKDKDVCDPEGGMTAFGGNISMESQEDMGTYSLVFTGLVDVPVNISEDLDDLGVFQDRGDGTFEILRPRG